MSSTRLPLLRERELQHVSHEKRIATAKPAIDNKEPKGFDKLQKRHYQEESRSHFSPTRRIEIALENRSLLNRLHGIRGAYGDDSLLNHHPRGLSHSGSHPLLSGGKHEFHRRKERERIARENQMLVNGLNRIASQPGYYHTKQTPQRHDPDSRIFHRINNSVTQTSSPSMHRSDSTASMPSIPSTSLSSPQKFISSLSSSPSHTSKTLSPLSSSSSSNLYPSSSSSSITTFDRSSFQLPSATYISGRISGHSVLLSAETSNHPEKSLILQAYPSRSSSQTEDDINASSNIEELSSMLELRISWSILEKLYGVSIPQILDESHREELLVFLIQRLYLVNKGPNNYDTPSFKLGINLDYSALNQPLSSSKSTPSLSSSSPFLSHSSFEHELLKIKNKIQQRMNLPKSPQEETKTQDIKVGDTDQPVISKSMNKYIYERFGIPAKTLMNGVPSTTDELEELVDLIINNDNKKMFKNNRKKIRLRKMIFDSDKENQETNDFHQSKQLSNHNDNAEKPSLPSISLLSVNHVISTLTPSPRSQSLDGSHEKPIAVASPRPPTPRSLSDVSPQISTRSNRRSLGYGEKLTVVSPNINDNDENGDSDKLIHMDLTSTMINENENEEYTDDKLQNQNNHYLPIDSLQISEFQPIQQHDNDNTNNNNDNGSNSSYSNDEFVPPYTRRESGYSIRSDYSLDFMDEHGNRLHMSAYQSFDQDEFFEDQNTLYHLAHPPLLDNQQPQQHYDHTNTFIHFEPIPSENQDSIYNTTASQIPDLNTEGSRVATPANNNIDEFPEKTELEA